MLLKGGRVFKIFHMSKGEHFITAIDITSKFAISIMVGAKAVDIMMSILHLSKGTGDDSVTQ